MGMKFGGSGGIHPAAGGGNDSSSSVMGEGDLLNTLFQLLGDVRFLWLPNTTDTTTSTTKDRRESTVTWSESLQNFDSAPGAIGAGAAVDFNGTDEEGDVPNSNAFDFGDGANDSPFSIGVLVRSDSAAGDHEILGNKDDSSNGSMYTFGIDGGGVFSFQLWDESASARLQNKTSSISADKWYLAVGTYDGSRDLAGMNTYLNGALDNATENEVNTYTAMEDLDLKLRIAHRLDSMGPAEGFFNGEIALAFITGKELTIDEIWSMKVALEDYYDITLD